MEKEILEYLKNRDHICQVIVDYDDFGNMILYSVKYSNRKVMYSFYLEKDGIFISKINKGEVNGNNIMRFIDELCNRFKFKYSRLIDLSTRDNKIYSHLCIMKYGCSWYNFHGYYQESYEEDLKSWNEVKKLKYKGKTFEELGKLVYDCKDASMNWAYQVIVDKIKYGNKDETTIVKKVY